MCRKTVPQGMWRGRLDDTRAPDRTLERTLNALLIQMMTPHHTGPGVDGKPGCRKNILPAPLFRRFRILASQRERKPDITSPLLALRIMDSLHHGQMPPQRLHQTARQHGDAILHALAVADQNLVPGKIHILDAQTQRFHQSHTGPI